MGVGGGVVGDLFLAKNVKIKMFLDSGKRIFSKIGAHFVHDSSPHFPFRVFPVFVFAFPLRFL